MCLSLWLERLDQDGLFGLLGAQRSLSFKERVDNFTRPYGWVWQNMARSEFRQNLVVVRVEGHLQGIVEP